MLAPVPSLIAMASANPPSPKFQVKREAILGAAALLFNARGVKGTTLADIAGSVGLATNSITYYYRKKEDLAGACFLRSIAAFEDLAATAIAERGVAARVTAFLRGQAQGMADMDQGRQAPLVDFNDIRALPDAQSKTVYAAYNTMFRAVRALLRGEDTAHLSRVELNARCHLLLSIANSMRFWFSRYEPDDYARVGGHLADIAIHGIGAAGSAWQDDDVDSAWPLLRGMDSTSESFLRAATVLVNEQGYRGASIDKISARLNVTKGSFYHHHDTKHDLIAECFERSFAVMREALRLAADGRGNGWTRLCAAGRALVRFQLSAQGPLLRATATSALPDEAHRGAVRATMRRITERMAGTVVDGMIDGSIRPLDPTVAAQAAAAAINAAAELQRWVPGARASNVAALYARPVFEGLLCPGMDLA